MDTLLGSLLLVPYTYAPRGWAFCQGQLLQISQNAALFALLRTTYGGNGVSTFALPDLTGDKAITDASGAALRWIICTAGTFPSHDSQPDDPDPLSAFTGSILLVPYNFAPAGWAFCQGQLLPIEENTQLFSLISGTFGGDGTTTFALPNLSGNKEITDASGAKLNWIICTHGTLPSRRPQAPFSDTLDAFMGSLSLLPYNFAPTGCLMCEGQLLDINQYQPLFTLFGNTYGGDGVTTLALPNLTGDKAIAEPSGTALHWIMVVNGMWPLQQ
jgi:microcystin-dependent protein